MISRVENVHDNIKNGFDKSTTVLKHRVTKNEDGKKKKKKFKTAMQFYMNI